MNTLDWITRILVVIGAINWGLVALKFNLVEVIFRIPVLITIVYALVGLSGIWELVKLFQK